MLLEVDSVSHRHRRGRAEVPVLEDASLTVDAGELVAVYGQRNAGKTTLLRIAAGLARPDAGEVRFDGRPLHGLSGRALARLHREEVAWVERAGPHSRELPVRMHVALPLYGRLGPTGAQRRASRALARVGAEGSADARWDELSDAGRTLVAIAHGIAREPRVLIVDDPTAGLGVVEREQVCGLLRDVAEQGGAAVLMAVPDMPSMLTAHSIRSLARGRLVYAAGDGPDGGGNVVAFPSSRRTA